MTFDATGFTLAMIQKFQEQNKKFFEEIKKENEGDMAIFPGWNWKLFFGLKRDAYCPLSTYSRAFYDDSITKKSIEKFICLVSAEFQEQNTKFSEELKNESEGKMAINGVSGPMEHRGAAEIRPNHLLALTFLLPYSNQEEQNLPT